MARLISVCRVPEYNDPKALLLDGKPEYGGVDDAESNSLSRQYTAADADEQPEPGCYFKRRWIIVILGFFGLLACYSFRVVLSVAIVPLVAEHPDWDNESTRGLILSSFFWGYILTQLPGGWLSKRFGGKIVFGLGVFISSILTCLTPLCRNSLPLFIACRVATGFTEGVTYPCMHSILSVWMPKSEKSRWATIIYSGAYLGTVLAMVTSPYIILSLTWPFVFYIYGALGLMWSVWWVILMESTPRAQLLGKGWACVRISQHEADYIARTCGSATDPNKLSESDPVPWKNLFRSGAVWAIVAAHFSVNWGFYILLTWIPTFFEKMLNFHLKESGIFSWMPYFAMFVICTLVGPFADFLINRKYLSTVATRKLFTGIGCLFPAVFLCLLSFTVNGPQDQIKGVIYLICAVGLSGFTLAGYSVNHIDISPKYASLLMGFSNTFGTLPGIFGVYATGAIVDQTHSWPFVFLLASGVYAAGALLFAIFAKGAQIDF